MSANRDIVFLSSIEWDRLWQGHHELASRLAASGDRVLFVENIGLRAPRWADRGRVTARLRGWSSGVAGGGPRQVADRLWVSSPLLLPPFGPRAQRAVNRRALIPAVARAARRIGLRDPIVWTYLPTDTARDLIAALRSPGSPVVYSCLADFAALSSAAVAVAGAERRLLAECDLVFAQAALMERCRRHAEHVVAYEPAVSTELFDPARRLPAPRALADLPGPVIGYAGGLHRHVDVDLVARLARERPGWTWVLVGPRQAPLAGLERLANVRLVGALAHRELPAAIAAFDACIVPYALSAYTATVSPTKIGEYLAMGKPVVSTPIPYAVDLERVAGGAVTTAGPHPEEFLAALERALVRAREADTVARCRALAAERSWTRRLEQVSSALTAAAGRARDAPQDRGEPARVAWAG